MLVFVETHDTNLEEVIKDLSQFYGYYPAKNIIDGWVKDYASFCYDSTSGELLFTKSRTQPYWQITEKLNKYKK
jgi:hypothetical protein